MSNTNDLWADIQPQNGRAAETHLTPKVVDDLPLNETIPDNEIFVIRNSESRYLTHLFHKYPGKFIPHIPRWALRRFLPRNAGMTVLDPFVGSGTTLVEASLYGQHSYGVDIDPLAKLITKVKTTVIPEARLRALPNEVISALGAKKKGSFRPSIPTLAHWFSDQAVADLSAIYDVIEQYREEEDIYDFLVVCFSSIIRKTSNADNQTMKTYVSHTNPKTPEAASPLFIKTVHTYTDRLIKFTRLVPNHGSTTVILAGDARTLQVTWKELNIPPVNLAITSPPYIKSVDYLYNQMAELFWIGHRWNLENQQKQNDFKRTYIGYDRASTKDAREICTTGIPDIDKYIVQVYERSSVLAYVMWRYFSDMNKHFAEMQSILSPGAHYVMVIGDSTLGGVSIPTHSLLLACAQKHGFQVASQFAYEIRNKYMHFPRNGRGGIVAHDWVMDLINMD